MWRYSLRILCLFLPLLSYLQANEEALFVSLGGHCEVAIQLRHHNLRTEAFPFDWMHTTDHEKFLQLLDEDFQFFVDPSYLFPNPIHPEMLENSRYLCEFRHDGPTNPLASFEEHVQELSSKYARRIERFRKLREYKGHIFFLRTAYETNHGGPHYFWQQSQERITTDQAKELQAALHRFFPETHFTLAIINYKETSLEKIENLPGIIEFKISGKTRTLDYAKLLHRLSKQ